MSCTLEDSVYWDDCSVSIVVSCGGHDLEKYGQCQEMMTEFNVPEPEVPLIRCYDTFCDEPMTELADDEYYYDDEALILAQ